VGEKDNVFKELKALLTPFKINRYDTDDWGAYERNLETNEHEIGKQNTQKIDSIWCRTSNCLKYYFKATQA
jgi:IS1 family transposase